jgi:hypothetical protein
LTNMSIVLPYRITSDASYKRLKVKPNQPNILNFVKIHMPIQQ